MALKDWKRKGKYFENKKGESVAILDFSKIEGKNPYWIEIIYDLAKEKYGKTDVTKFKSKSQALKFAKLYMRTH